MGLFSKRQPDPIAHPPVARTVHVHAALDAVIAHLAAYGELWSPKWASEHELFVAEVGGWTAIRLPDEVHPWQLHNLAYWMLDCAELGDEPTAVIAVSGPGPDHPGYRLVRDPKLPDALCGWDDEGDGWTVRVPGNDVVRPEDVPVPRSQAVPSGHRSWHPVRVMLEDPGPGMNERNAPTAKSRRHLERTSFTV